MSTHACFPHNQLKKQAVQARPWLRRHMSRVKTWSGGCVRACVRTCVRTCVRACAIGRARWARERASLRTQFARALSLLMCYLAKQTLLSRKRAFTRTALKPREREFGNPHQSRRRVARLLRSAECHLSRRGLRDGGGQPS
eukprot:6174589-Pleurochrysis_carterae.AAC.5